MRRLSFVAAAAFPFLMALTGCNQLPGATAEAHAPPRPENVVDFPALYGQNCQACHGAGGQNGPAMDLANPEYLAMTDDATLHRIIASGMPGTQMPAWAQSAGGMLTDQQIDAIVAGIRHEWSKPNVLGGATPPPLEQPGGGDEKHGQQVYQARCAMCHGGPARQQLTSPVYLSLVSGDALRSIIVAGRPDIGQPDWEHDSAKGAAATPLTNQEVTDIVAFLGSLRNPATVSAASIPVPPRR